VAGFAVEIQHAPEWGGKILVTREKGKDKEWGKGNEEKREASRDSHEFPEKRSAKTKQWDIQIKRVKKGAAPIKPN